MSYSANSLFHAGSRAAFAATLGFAMIVSTGSQADLAPPAGYRSVTVCHQIVSSRHGDLVLIGGVSRSPVDQNWSGYSLQEVPVGQCLPSSYRAQYSIFALSIGEWEKVATAKGQAGPSERKLDGKFGQPAGIFTDRYGDGEVRVPDADPLHERTMEWAVAGLRGKNPVLYVKRIRDRVKVDGGELQDRITELDPPAALRK